ncbi:putative glutamyl-trna amidotransferase subunit a [Diplodia seriata]|uniref:Putative glutamyl-trna amidotransferase subunit a n=1 Tax=Diplodia seriata TaxID=420778 RepID=A0A0G2GM47_9PEZI|nr:putative glutamyl-trna amidotransferase subunit a [Diplodia seriata]
MASSSSASSHLLVDAKPFPFSFPFRHTALLVVDMQREFLVDGGFSHSVGANLSAVQACVRPTMRLLDACREARLPVFHTRVGFEPDLSDCPSIALASHAPVHGNAGPTVGDRGAMGRYLIRGEYGHDIIDELRALPGEVVIDKPGKGAFWNTELLHKLKARAITHLLVAGAAYRSGVSAEAVMDSLYRKIEVYKGYDPAVWIHLESREAVLEAARAVQEKWPNPRERPPLFGIPFSIKDSIDIAGYQTTTACPPLARMASASAPVYEKIIANGGIFIGKTNMDQLGTGMTGCRSPEGIPHSTMHRDFIAGGSSSGSAVSVGAGLVSFSIGTDTAGSGRIPAAFNDVVGFKPTRGLVSMRGITPACASLDCIAVLARNIGEARIVWQVIEGADAADRYSKLPIALERHINAVGPQRQTFRFGIPPPEALDACHPLYRKIFNHVIRKLVSIGGVLKPIDWTPFERAGKLLYDGTLVMERLANHADDWLEKNRNYLHPVIVEVFDGAVARQSTAVQAYRDLQAKALYTRQAEETFSAGATGVDVIVTPTAPAHWTIEEVHADPVKKNSALGEYTHAANVLDLCAISVPAGLYPLDELLGTEGNEGRLPFGVHFMGGSRMDAELLEVARRFEQSLDPSATENERHDRYSTVGGSGMSRKRSRDETPTLVEEMNTE